MTDVFSSVKGVGIAVCCLTTLPPSLLIVLLSRPEHQYG
jgi:hypothetical protein